MFVNLEHCMHGAVFNPNLIKRDGTKYFEKIETRVYLKGRKLHITRVMQMTSLCAQ